MPTKKTPAKKEPKKETTPKKAKDPFAKYIGKKTNEGQKVISVVPKVIKRVNQPAVDMVEMETETGEREVMPEEQLKLRIKGLKK